MDLEETKNQLLQWIPSKYKEEDCISIKDNVIHLRLFTDTNEYKIIAIPKDKDYEGYLGCIASSRKPRAGETWTRGNDLPDGYFCYETWVRILGGIVGYELVKIHKPVENIEEVIKENNDKHS